MVYDLTEKTAIVTGAASEDASFVTGNAYPVDGGYMAL